jgi:pimeloyl-ACP methyl ester carboxylesterase
MIQKILLQVLMAIVCVECVKAEVVIKECGTGNKVLVMIPGFACSGDVWDETAQVMSKDYHCLQLTLPGFAGAKALEKPSFKNMEQLIVNELRKRNLTHVSLMGHSMGGGLAMAIAAHYPDMVDKLYIVDALPCLSALYNPAFKTNPNKDYTAEIEKMMQMDDARYEQMTQMGAATQTLSIDKIPTINSWAAKTDRRTYFSMYYDYTNTDLRNDIKNIKAPMLVLLEPQFLGIDQMIKKQFEGCPGANIRYATKGLHFIMYDDWDWFIKQCAPANPDGTGRW